MRHGCGGRELITFSQTWEFTFEVESTAIDHNQTPGSFDLKQIEFQAVLDLTIAINQNQPEQGLYRILEDYLLEKLGIGHFSLFLKDEEWHNPFCYGRIVSGWPDLSEVMNQAHVSKLTETSATFVVENPHIEFAVPFYYNRQLRGLVLCSKVEKFAPPLEAEALALIQTLMSLVAMAIENFKLLAYRLKQEALRREIEIARQVQQMLFPRNLPNNDFLKLYTTYLPHMDVSGDYYDYIPLEGRNFALCVADVSGKGMSAALLMSNFQACLRTLMLERRDLTDVVSTVNTLLCQNSNLERFITAFIGVYNDEARTFTYVNSGHNPPCFIDEQGNLERLTLGSPILGIFPTLPHLHVGQTKIDRPLLFSGYTDGLTEIESEDGNEYGPEKLEEYLVENRNEKLPVLHQRLLNRLEAFAGERGFSDDITLLSAQINP